MISFLYNRLIHSRSRSILRLLEIAVPHITRVIDPQVSVKIGQTKLVMPLSHRIPFNVGLNKYYDTLLPRLGRVFQKEKGTFCMIDVGANIGDTANMVAEGVPAKILCVEPDPEFFALLEKNTRNISGVTRVNIALGDGTEKPASVVMNRDISGSAILQLGEGLSLDLVLDDNPSFKSADVLKIDTDGYDFKVLRGSTRLLRETKPVLFFEHSPEHCVKVAHEDPLAVFEFLTQAGYSHHVFYDSQGHLMAELSSSEQNAIQQLVHYAHVTGKFYDILSFHDDREGLRTRFMAAEQAFFPLFDRPYLKKFAQA